MAPLPALPHVSSSPPTSGLHCTPSPSLPWNEGRHAMEVGDWLICTRMDCTLFRIFFWCPAKVTPILRRSLEDRQTDRKVNGQLRVINLFCCG